MAKPTSWKETGKLPRVIAAAIRRGLKMADAISVIERVDGAEICVTFKSNARLREQGRRVVGTADYERKRTIGRAK